MSEREVVIVGAGPAGLSVALALADAGVRALLIDGASEVASSWRSRYDRLRLNSPRMLSHLPGRPFPKGTPMFPDRDQVVAHLEQHSRDLDLRLGTRAERVARTAAGWTVETASDEIHARQVVVATGHNRVPLIPGWPGRAAFGGQLLHSSDYRNPEPFAGRDVLVVGPGCSGMEIAYDLAEGGAARVSLAVRTPPNLALRSGPGGLPGDLIARPMMRLPVRLADRIERLARRMDFGDLSEFGLPVPEEGTFARLHRQGAVPAIVDKEVVEAIKARRFTIVPGVESLDETGVTLTGGTRIEPEAVVCATGFRRGLEPLVGHLGVLDEAGHPRAVGPDAPAPGLRFCGFVVRPAMLGHTSTEARRIAKAVARELAA